MMIASPANIREYRVLYQAIFRRIPIPVAIVDRDLAVCDANEAYARLFGEDLSSLLGAPLAVIFATGDLAAGARAAASGGDAFSTEAAAAGGIPVRVRVESIEDEEEPRGLAIITPSGDVSVDDRLLELFAAIRVIKHEINNPLTGALGNINLLLRRSDLDEKMRRRLATAEQEIKKVSLIVVKLSELAPTPEAKTTTEG